MNKKYLINLYPVSLGGGLQNASSFITMLASDNKRRKDSVVVVRKNTTLERLCIESDIDVLSVSDSFLGRIFIEFLYIKYLCVKFEIERVFTLFGNTPLNRPSCKCISGFAYSNIIEKNVDFWFFLSRRSKLLARIKDWIRLKSSLRSDVIILETYHLHKIAKQNRTFNNVELKVVQMSPSSMLNSLSALNRNDVLSDLKIEYNILYLSGAHPNKNIHRLAPIILELNYKLNIKLIVTLPKSDYTNTVTSAFYSMGIIDKLKNIGPITPDQVGSCLEKSDFIINVANLESFSNNWVEAWASGRVLICNDKSYAYSSCENAAIYIDLDDPKKAAELIISAFSKKNELQNAGNELLKRLPSAKKRYEDFWHVIEK
ncbi:glycosyltransferase [Vibrio apostichopi]|uniref:glycosyltransferase n=1 Tax=Vibrio apostichopi TaxID=3035453 RepID=UPI0025728419|nr:glycosyltransferase [Vibrio sp. FE10]